MWILGATAAPTEGTSLAGEPERGLTVKGLLERQRTTREETAHEPKEATQRGDPSKGERNLERDTREEGQGKSTEMMLRWVH